MKQKSKFAIKKEPILMILSFGLGSNMPLGSLGLDRLFPSPPYFYIGKKRGLVGRR